MDREQVIPDGVARREIIRPLGEDLPNSRLSVITAVAYGDIRTDRCPRLRGRRNRMGLLHGFGIAESPVRISTRMSTHLSYTQGSIEELYRIVLLGRRISYQDWRTDVYGFILYTGLE